MNERIDELEAALEDAHEAFAIALQAAEQREQALALLLTEAYDAIDRFAAEFGVTMRVSRAALAAPQEPCQHPNAVVAADTRGGAARWCSDCLTYPQEATQMVIGIVPPNPEAERVLDALDAEARASVGLDGETQEIEGGTGMSDKYMLRGQEPVLCNDLMEWATWFETADRHVAKTVVEQHGENAAKVSTVFLGLDHAFGDGPPVLFETMVFGGDDDGYQRRYRSWAEAALGHAETVATLAARESLHEDEPAPAAEEGRMNDAATGD